MALLPKVGKNTKNQNLNKSFFNSFIPKNLKIFKFLKFLRKSKFKNCDEYKYLPKHYPFKYGWQKTMPYNPKWQDKGNVLIELARLKSRNSAELPDFDHENNNDEIEVSELFVEILDSCEMVEFTEISMVDTQENSNSQ